MQGLKVEMVIVGDDCSLPGKGLAGRRGIAGTILVNKVVQSIPNTADGPAISIPDSMCSCNWAAILQRHSVRRKIGKPLSATNVPLVSKLDVPYYSQHGLPDFVSEWTLLVSF